MLAALADRHTHLNALYTTVHVHNIRRIPPRSSNTRRLA